MNIRFVALIILLLTGCASANTQVPASLVTSTVPSSPKCLNSSATNVQTALNDIDACFGTGVLGWTLTDGTHTINGVNNVTIIGGTVSGTSPNGTITITGSTSPGSPTTSFQYNNSGNFAGGNMYQVSNNIGVGTTTQYPPATLFSVGTSTNGGSLTHNAFNVDANGDITNLGGLIANINASGWYQYGGGFPITFGNIAGGSGDSVRIYVSSSTGHIDFAPSNGTILDTINSMGYLGILNLNPQYPIDLGYQTIQAGDFHSPNGIGGITSQYGINFDPTGTGPLVYLTSSRQVGIGKVPTNNSQLDINGLLQALTLNILTKNGINWSDIYNITATNVNWSDPSFGTNSTGYCLQAMAGGGVNFGACINGASGVNWNSISGMQSSVNVAGFNWQNLTGINTSAINWQNDLFNNFSINWASFKSLVPGGAINWSDFPTSGIATWNGSNKPTATATTGSGSVVLATSPTLVTPALGTPSACVLTNATGLPESGVTNLVASGKTFTCNNTITIAGTDSTTQTFPSTSQNIAGLTATQTFTNKRITRRTTSISGPGATPSINTDSYDEVNLTAIATPITSMTTNLAGTPQAGDFLEITFLDNGTGEGITWGASFASTTTTLPATTVASKKLRVLLEWDATTSIWDCVAVT